MVLARLRPDLRVICLAVISAGLTLGQEEVGSVLSDSLPELGSGDNEIESDIGLFASVNDTGLDFDDGPGSGEPEDECCEGRRPSSFCHVRFKLHLSRLLTSPQ